MIYQSDCYREVLRTSLLSRKKSIGKSYNFQNLASACRVQKSYLSRVMKGDAHLNTDQVFLAAEFLNFNEEERTYVQLLNERERSVVPRKRRELSARIEDMQSKWLKSESHLPASAVQYTDADKSEYYLSIHFQLAHMLLLIPRFRDNLKLLAEQLRIDDSELTKILAKLETMGIIRFHDSRYEVVQENMHLSADSHIYPYYRTLLRLKSLERVDQLSREQAYNFSAIFTANEATSTEIKRRFLEFLKGVEDLVQDAPQEHAYHISFDLFPWTG